MVGCNGVGDVDKGECNVLFFKRKTGNRTYEVLVDSEMYIEDRRERERGKEGERRRERKRE